jgi:putative transposase
MTVAGKRPGSVANLADRSAWCTFAGNGFGGEHVMIEFKGSPFERDVILWAVSWYVAYPISYRQLEEMIEEHGVEVDHATLNRWVLKYVPRLDQEFRARKRPVGSSSRMDETYVRVKGPWKYLYRAVDKAGTTADFLLTAKRDRKAALRFLRKAIKWNGTPEKITIDKSGANTAAIESGKGEALAERSAWVRGVKEQAAGAAGRQYHPTGRQHYGPHCRYRQHTDERAIGDHEVAHFDAFQHGNRGCRARRSGRGAHDLLTRAVTRRMDNAASRMRRL